MTHYNSGQCVILCGKSSGVRNATASINNVTCPQCNTLLRRNATLRKDGRQAAISDVT